MTTIASSVKIGFVYDFSLEFAMANTVKLLNPRNVDTKYIGTEPEWKNQPQEHERQSVITRAFTFYNYFYGQKEAKEMALVWLQAQERTHDYAQIRAIPEGEIIPTLGWICRMATVGLELTDSELATINNLLDEQYQRVNNKNQDQKTTKKVSTAKQVVLQPNIQDRLREKMSECAGEIEGIFDDFIQQGLKNLDKFGCVNLLRARNVSPQLISMITDCWHRRKKEFEAIDLQKKDQLAEGYRNFNKTQVRNLVKFADQIINDCGNYCQIKKIERKPRVKKPVSTEKLVAKFCYLKAFSQFKLTSESPVKLVNASEAWLFDSKKRKLIHVVADTHSGTFTIKNNAIIGFDVAQTQQKSLRKPAEQLKAIMTASKPALRKLYKDIRSIETKFNGRSNEHMIILKVW